MVLRKRTCSRFRFHVQMPKRKHWPMAAQPSWKSFRESVYALEADGENGFEGLVRRLLEAEMRLPFYLARKGDQPAGDASSPNRGVAMEAKRYSDATSLPEDKIIGAIMRALDEIRALDVFVLASTKALGQLAARFERESQSSGLDILPLSLGDKLTDFGALCVQHWNVAGPSVHLTTRPWRAWAETQLAEPETQAVIERLRRSLSGLKTQEFVSEQCGRLLAERFMGNPQAHVELCWQPAGDEPAAKNRVGATPGACEAERPGAIGHHRKRPSPTPNRKIHKPSFIQRFPRAEEEAGHAERIPHVLRKIGVIRRRPAFVGPVAKETPKYALLL